MRQQKVPDLEAYLRGGVPPQSISWQVQSSDEVRGTFPVAVRVADRPPVTLHIVLGDQDPPSPAEFTDDSGLIRALKIEYPKSDTKRIFSAPFGRLFGPAGYESAGDPSIAQPARADFTANLGCRVAADVSGGVPADDVSLPADPRHCIRDTTLRQTSATLFLLLFLSAVSPRAKALVEINDSVARTYSLSKAVWVGEITSVEAARKLVVVKGTRSIKGDAVPETFDLIVGTPADFLAKVSVGSPVVLFLSKGNGPVALHLADSWMLANSTPGASPPVWAVTGVFEASNKSFPGRTVALVRLLEEIKAGKPTLLTKAENNVFRDGWKSLATLNVTNPMFLMPVDANDNHKPCLLVGTSAGAKLFAPVPKATPMPPRLSVLAHRPATHTPWVM